jgi:hypothetical protein
VQNPEIAREIEGKLRAILMTKPDAVATPVADVEPVSDEA